MGMGTSNRLMSLDLLRGLDMLLLVVVAPVLLGYHAAWGLPEWMTEQLTHADWEGLRVWDLIMPWFIFMSGAAIPFALPKYLSDGKPKVAFWVHLFKRVAMLWLLGMVVQGNLPGLNPELIRPYNNTLQAIAAGYFIAAVVWLVPWKWGQVTVTCLLAAGYGLLLATFGDYTQKGNFAVHVEQLVFPSNKDGYGWTLTSMMFGAMALYGMHCAQLLRCSYAPYIKFALLLVLGNVLLGVGLILGFWEPAIKRIYTVSFTAQALGWGTLALALLYLVADIWKVTWGSWVILLFGRYALFAYLCGEFFSATFATLARSLTYGVKHVWNAEGYTFTLAVVYALLIVIAVALRDRLKTKR